MSCERGEYGNRNSSRVLRPPGGGSSNIFGVAEEPSRKDASAAAQVHGDGDKSSQPVETMQTTRAEQQADSYADADEDKKAKQEEEEEDDEVKAAETGASNCADSKTQDSATAAVTSTTSNVDSNLKKGRGGGCGYNPITGQPYTGNNDSNKAASATVDSSRSQIRIRQPPGGASTKLW